MSGPELRSPVPRSLFAAHGPVAGSLMLLLAMALSLWTTAVPLLLMATMATLLARHLRTPGTRSQPGPASPLFWSLLLYVLYLIGLAWSDDMGYAWFDLGIKASMGLLPLVLWAVPDDRRVGGRTVLGAFVAGASIAVVICVLVALARTLTDVLPGRQGFWAGQWIGSRFSLFMHPTYFAVHLCLALVVVLLREARPGDRGYRRITPWLLVAGVLFCGSKAGWIVLVLLYGLLLLVRWRTPLRRSLLLAGLTGAVAFAVSMAVSPFVREKVEQLDMLGDHAPVAPDASGSTGLRQLTWTAAIELLQENWLLGTGTGDVKNELLARYAEKGYVHALEQRLNAHSQLLQTPLTVGVVGGVLIALLLAVPAWSAIRRRDALMVAFVLVLGVNWAFESMLEVQAGVVFLTVAGLMLALRGPSTGGSGPRMVMLTQYYPPETGAPQNRLHATAMGLADLGMEVTVLTGMPNYPDMKVQEGYRGAWYRQELIDGIDVRRSWLYVPMGKGIFPRLANYFSFVMSAWWTGSAELRRSDVLLVESPPLFLGITAMLLARATGASLVFNVSDLWPESAVQLGLVRNQLLIGASTGLEELCYRRSALITGQTRGIVADIERRMPDKEVHWLPNGVDLPTMQALPVEPGMRAHFGIPAGAMVCLYGGIIGHAQGLETVVAAAEELRDEPGVLFLLVGEGPVKSELQDLVGRKGLENVRFLDRMPRASMLGLLKECDAVVVPLRRNDLFKGAIPSKIFEALALGKPLLLGVDGEARDLFIRDGECGTFVEPEDPVALAEAVRRYRDDPALRAAHGANGLRYVKAHFDRAVITHGLWVALQEVLARRSARR